MKKTKTIIIYILIAVVSACITFTITLYIYKNNKNIVGENHTKPYEVSLIKDYTEELPEFTVVIRGGYTTSITNRDLDNIKVYEFYGDEIYNWGFIERKYVGFKLKDYLNTKNMNDFEKIEFKGKGSTSIIYEKDEITEDAFIIIYCDGEQLDENSVSFINFDYDYKYSIEGLIGMEFL